MSPDADLMRNDRAMRPVFNLGSTVGIIAIGFSLLAGCSTARAHGPSRQAEVGPSPTVRLPLKAHGLPDNFFELGADTKCSSQIIGYRFVVWLNSDAVAVGFNTSPNCRRSPNESVSGALRVLVFDSKGALKASRELPYLADGNGELVADGEAMPGPGGTLLVRIESVNLDGEGRHESKSGVRLLDANLKDTAEIDEFLEQTTFVDHDLVFQNGFTLSGPRTYSTFAGAAAKKISEGEISWPTGAMDRRFGEHGFAFMLCSQELRPGTQVTTNVVHVGAKFRCSLKALNGEEKNENGWEFALQDGQTAALVGILADGSVAALVHSPGSNGEQLTVFAEGGRSSIRPWVPAGYVGTVDAAVSDLSRYSSFATNDARPCNPLVRALGTGCDESGDGRLFIFDKGSPSPLVSRTFPKNGRAALSPDGLHYASFEAGELRLYSLPVGH